MRRYVARFFFIAALATAVWGIVGIITGVYIIKLLGDTRLFMRTAQRSVERVAEAIENLQREAGYRVAGISILMLFWKMWRNLKRRV